MRPLRPRIGLADEPIAHRHLHAWWHRAGQLSGNQPKVADRLRQRVLRAGPLDEHHIATHIAMRTKRDGKPLRRVLVMKREHGGTDKRLAGTKGTKDTGVRR